MKTVNKSVLIWYSPAEMFTLVTQVAVSYTHLDVYKRQILVHELGPCAGISG